MAKMTNDKVYEMITNKVIEKMQEGRIPWQKAWKSGTTTLRSGRVIDPCSPINYKSKRNYKGINYWMLQMNDYNSTYWFTFKQAKEYGGCVKKGEKGTPVIFWQVTPFIKKHDDGTEEKKQSFLLKYYTVFNLEQIDGLENLKEIVADVVKEKATEIEPIQAIDLVIENIKNCAQIDHKGGSEAYYRPSSDSIHLPKRNNFKDAESYYSVKIHEIAHSTGHKSRLNRETLVNNDGFGKEIYSREELVAELTASYVMGVTGFETEKTFDNSVAYLQSWIKALKNDSKMIFWASKEAEKASNYIFNIPQVTYDK